MTLYKEPAPLSTAANSNGDAIENNGKNIDDVFIENEEIKASISTTDLNTSSGHGGLEAEDDDDNDNEIIGD